MTGRYWPPATARGTGILPAVCVSQVTRSLDVVDIGYVFLAVC